MECKFTLPADTPAERSRLDQLKHSIQQHLGDYVYAEDQTTLEEHVAARLAQRGATLALAEVGSGGSLAAGLGGTAAALPVLAGAFVAPTEQQLGRLLGLSEANWSAAMSSAERAGQLAAAAAAATGSSWAIAVGQPQTDGADGHGPRSLFACPMADWTASESPWGQRSRRHVSG